MTAITFDTLAYTKKLRAVGVEEKQAEVQAEVLASVIDEQMASSRDLKELELAMKHDLKELEFAMNHDLKELELNLKHDTEKLKHDLTLRLGGMLAVGIGAIAALVKIL
jgi:hypothetical protein